MSQREAKVFLFCLLLLSYPVLLWVEYQTAKDSYLLWRDGVSKTAKVVRFDETSVNVKSVTHYYILEVDQQYRRLAFSYPLQKGSTVSILYLPGRPDDVIRGDKQSTLFEIYAQEVGFPAQAVLWLIFTVCSVTLFPYVILRGFSLS